MRVLLISIYEMGRQPFGLASPAAWLRAAGCTVECADLSREPLDDDGVRQADLVGVYLPMHTATRLAAPALSKIRRLNPRARICAFGLYAPLNAEWLRSLGVEEVFGGEFEGELTAYAAKLSTTEDAEDTEENSVTVLTSVSSVSSVVESFFAYAVTSASNSPPNTSSTPSDRSHSALSGA